MITRCELRQKQRDAAFPLEKEERETVMKRSTYRLLVQSEEKGRDILETALYALFALSAAAAVWQFADQPAILPLRETGSMVEQQAQGRFPS